jgi:hypothetical protein
VSLVDEVRPTDMDGWRDAVLAAAEPSDAKLCGASTRRRWDRGSRQKSERWPLLDMMTGVRRDAKRMLGAWGDGKLLVDGLEMTDATEAEQKGGDLDVPESSYFSYKSPTEVGTTHRISSGEGIDGRETTGPLSQRLRGPETRREGNQISP